MPVEPPPTIHTSERIMAAAVDLFHRQGYNATSLRQIADAVDLQVGSLYNHLSSKEELLSTIMRRVMVELIGYVEPALDEVGDDPVERVRAFMRASVGFHATRRAQTFIGNAELRSLSEQHRSEVVELRDRYELLLFTPLSQAADSGALAVPDVQLATYSALAMCSSVARWYRPDGRLSISDVEKLVPMNFGPLAALDGG